MKRKREVIYILEIRYPRAIGREYRSWSAIPFFMDAGNNYSGMTNDRVRAKELLDRLRTTDVSCSTQESRTAKYARVGVVRETKP